VEVLVNGFVTLVLVGDEWSASKPRRLILGEKLPGIHWIRDWVGPTVCLDDMEKILDTTGSALDDICGKKY
jgi:hypothetical protein